MVIFRAVRFFTLQITYPKVTLLYTARRRDKSKRTAKNYNKIYKMEDMKKTVMLSYSQDVSFGPERLQCPEIVKEVPRRHIAGPLRSPQACHTVAGIKLEPGEDKTLTQRLQKIYLTLTKPHKSSIQAPSGHTEEEIKTFCRAVSLYIMCK